MPKHSLRLLIAPALLAALPLAPAGSLPRSAPPAWFLDHLRQEMVAGGRHVADNGEYVGPDEPHDAYGVEWTWGIGRLSLRGRLFAMLDGREVQDVWEMRTVWHPGRNEAHAYQFGADGTFASGTLRPLEDGAVEIEQTFTAPDGSTRAIRHESIPLEGGGSVTHSFVRAGEEWKPNRSYTWVPTPRGERED